MVDPFLDDQEADEPTGHSLPHVVGSPLGGFNQPEDPTCGGPGTEMVHQARTERVEALRRAEDFAPSEGRLQ